MTDPERRAERLLLALALLVFGWSFDRDPGPNVVAHVDQASAIVLDGTLSIDRFVVGRAEPNTIDWSRGPDGRHFPAKAPGMALLSLPVAAPVLLIERALGVDPASDRWVWRNGAILNWLLNVPAAAATLVLLLRLCRRLGIALGPALAGVAAVGFGSAYHAYATIFYAHVPAASLVAAGGACALAVLGGGEAATERSVPDGPRPSPRAALLPALSGLLLGLAAFVDYAAAFAVLVFGLLLLVLRPRALPLFVVGGLPVLAALLAYHQAAFGSPLSTAYAHQNPIFAAADGSFISFPPPARRLFDLTVSPYRGLFFFSPALLLAAPGALAAWRSGDVRLRALALAAPAILALYFTLNASYRVWWGGATTGPRFPIPALPLFAPLVALGVARLPRLGVALVALSVMTYFAIASMTIMASEHAKVPLLDPVLRGLAHDRLGRDNLGRTLVGLRGLPSLAPMLLGAALLALGIARAARAAERPQGASAGG